MKLISMTLTGNSEAIIGDALRSAVDWVDACLVVDTGVTDRSLEIAREVAGSKYVEREFAWTGDFAAARNFCLEAAAAWGADWAVTLDTDERLQVDPAQLRQNLAAPGICMLLVDYEDHSYSKERFFRLPMPIRWIGPTHEAFPLGSLGFALIPEATFSELPKTPEQCRQKFERDRTILTAHIDRFPSDPRWHFYLGETLRNLGRDEEAARAYEACAALRGWDEESAWACYRAAECHCRMDQYQRALDLCTEGLARHAGVGELAWLAGFAAHRLGRPLQSTQWARLAIAMGFYRGHGRASNRIGFKHLPALYEGPYDLLRFTLKELGDADGAAQAEADYAAARQARLETELR